MLEGDIMGNIMIFLKIKNQNSTWKKKNTDNPKFHTWIIALSRRIAVVARVLCAAPSSSNVCCTSSHHQGSTWSLISLSYYVACLDRHSWLQGATPWGLGATLFESRCWQMSKVILFFLQSSIMINLRFFLLFYASTNSFCFSSFYYC